ncbi:MAG: hypothetical protein H6R26_263, partial [Proteobacteria bacterium]|nr:hypothetical protein [Pseudomonadota bacterium]
MQSLLGHLASAGQPGLCILTSRERIRDLEEYERSDDHPAGAVVRCDLGNLSDTDGARLLYKLGARRAGAAAIGPDDAELRQASHEVHGHALTLSLLGGYLTLAHEGDIRQRDEVALEDADEAQGGRAFKVMAAYETWFQREGERGARELAALRLLGFFDRPADAECLTALRATPPIPGLTEPLVGLNTAQWKITLKRLEQCGLIEKAEPDSSAIDAHPLVREYLAKALRERQPEAWREGHRRLYEYLKGSGPDQPEGLAGLQPLYQAVAHGCLAGLVLEAFEEVYFDRILRGTEYEGYYSYRKLGAFGANLGAVACFFEEPWQRVSPDLSEDYQAWLFNEAALQLRALGRLSESRERMQAALEMHIHLEGPVNAANAAIVASNLSEVTLALGRVVEAVCSGERAVDLSGCIPDAYELVVQQCVVIRTTLADALYQQGEREKALQLFREAEATQALYQPFLLYSVSGFRYCDLLLAEAERAVWRGSLTLSAEDGRTEGLLAACHDVEQRAQQTLRWEECFPGAPILDFALDHLTLARAALYQSMLGDSALDRAGQELAAAVDDLRAAGQQQEMPRGLLTGSWLRCLQGNAAGARADLDEAWQIASRGGM